MVQQGTEAPDRWKSKDTGTEDYVDETEKLARIKKAAGSYFTAHNQIPEMIEKIAKDMKQAAKDMEFERAAELRDRIRQLRRLSL